jgi:hypothetical protein
MVFDVSTVGRRRRKTKNEPHVLTIAVSRVFTLGEGLAEKAALCEFFLAERKMRIFSPRLWN